MSKDKNKSSNKTDALRAQREANVKTNGHNKVDHSPHTAEERKARGMEPDADAPAGGSKPKRAKLSRVKQNAVKARRFGAGIARTLARIAAWAPFVVDGTDVVGAAKKSLDAAAKLAVDAADKLDGIPDTYAPRPKGGPRVPRATKELPEGSKIDLREKDRAEYADLLPGGEEDTTGLTVKRFKGKNVVCTTKSGVTILLPRGKVCPADSSDGGDDNDVQENVAQA